MSAPSEPSRQLAEAVAAGLSGARAAGAVVDLGYGGASVECAVRGFRPGPGHVAAQCAYVLRADALGADPVFTSASGYGDDEAAAVIGGGRTWAQAFGPVLQAALGGAPVSAGAEVLSVKVDGQARRLVVNGLTRGFGDPPRATIAASFARFAGKGWLSEKLLASGALPLLHPTRPTVLSVFVIDGPTRVVEVKLDGADWPGAAAAFARVPAPPHRAVIMHRELAILLPAGPALPPSRARLEATLAGLRAELPAGLREPAAWRGWAAHRGVLAPPLSPPALAALGELPADYARFLGEVSSGGAGPGYGLLPPAASAAYAAGGFSEDGPLRGVVVLGTGGCDTVWVLVRRGPRAGEVWMDRATAGERRRVAPSFTAWYADWLADAVAGRFGRVDWEAARCVTPDLLGQWAAAGRKPLPAGAIVLSSGGSALAADGAPVDPCPACLVAAGLQELREEVFAAAAPFSALQPPPERAWWRR